MSCYPCPAGRESMHECWKTYTKDEDKSMPRTCQLCDTEFYKELPKHKESYSRCIPCVPCFGFTIIQDCDPRHGRICGDECAVDFYKINFECRECCHCTTGDVKEEGCRNSPSKKVCSVFIAREGICVWCRLHMIMLFSQMYSYLPYHFFTTLD